MRILHLSIQELERSMTHLALIRTGPKLSTPEQCERWSDLMPLLTWQLWLAKDVVTEIRLPTAIVSASIDPGQGCTINASTFNQDWDSAVAPKRRGNSDGWQTRKFRTPRCRSPVLEKGKGRFQKSPKSIS